MRTLFKLYLIALISNWLVLADCYAIDSASIVKLARNSNNLTPMVSFSKPDKNQCVNIATSEEINEFNTHSDRTATCPKEYPFPRSFTTSVTGYKVETGISIALQCCKEKIKYKKAY